MYKVTFLLIRYRYNLYLQDKRAHRERIDILQFLKCLSKKMSSILNEIKSNEVTKPRIIVSMLLNL